MTRVTVSLHRVCSIINTNGQWCTYGTNIFLDMIKVLLLRNSGTWFLYERKGMVLNKLDLRNVWGSANRLTDYNVPI